MIKRAEIIPCRQREACIRVRGNPAILFKLRVFDALTEILITVLVFTDDFAHIGVIRVRTESHISFRYLRGVL